MSLEYNCPLVSIIIPCFNSSLIISKALESLLIQSFKNFEVIIIDDGSDDFSSLSRIVAEYQSSLNIKLIELPVNCGAPRARNVGIAEAKGSFIAFLDSDDIWHEYKLSIQLDAMMSSGASISAHAYIDDIQTRGVLGDFSNDIKHHIVNLQRFCLGNPFATPTVMVKSDGFIPFDERFRVVDDYRCWIENVKKGRAIYIEVALAAGFKPAIGGGGLTANIERMHRACLDVLRHMYADGVISFSFYMIAILIEQIKYPVRRVRHIFRRVF
ncbi:glycosyltransferase family 2 protein [Aeromonas veronii]